MKKVTTEQLSRPESDLDPEVLAFRSQFESVSPLDELVRQGAQQMLQTAIEAEVQDFLLTHSGRVDEQGRRQVVRNGYLPSGEKRGQVQLLTIRVIFISFSECPEPHEPPRVGMFIMSSIEVSVSNNCFSTMTIIWLLKAFLQRRWKSERCALLLIA